MCHPVVCKTPPSFKGEPENGLSLSLLESLDLLGAPRLPLAALEDDDGGGGGDGGGGDKEPPKCIPACCSNSEWQCGVSCGGHVNGSLTVHLGTQNGFGRLFTVQSAKWILRGTSQKLNQ